MSLEVLHDEDAAHDSLIVTVHHAAQRGEQAGHEDVWVLKHTDDAMFLGRVGTANNRLAVGSTGGLDSHLEKARW